MFDWELLSFSGSVERSSGDAGFTEDENKEVEKTDRCGHPDLISPPIAGMSSVDTRNLQTSERKEYTQDHTAEI